MNVKISLHIKITRTKIGQLSSKVYTGPPHIKHNIFTVYPDIMRHININTSNLEFVVRVFFIDINVSINITAAD